MRCVRLVLVFAAAVFVVAVSEAQPPPLAAVQPTPLAVVLLAGIDDPVVVAELKLKDEQVQTLVARRKELWDETYTTAPSKLAEKMAARTEATDAMLKKTLTADQYKRAVQLGAQSVLRGPIFGKGADPDTAPPFRLTTVTATTLRRYPELATAFKLTDDQKKQLTAPAAKDGGRPARSITLTKEQADAAKEFLGPVAKTWQTKSDPRIAARPTAPAGFSLLEARDVRADLKLADADAKVFVALSEKWQKLGAGRFAFGERGSDLSPKEVAEQASALKTESEKALAALTPQQAARLKQIALQDQLIGGGGFARRVSGDVHIEQIYTNAAVAKEVTLTEKQAEELKALREAFEKEAAVVLGAAEAIAPAEKKINDLVAVRRAKADKLLTPDQTAKLKALLGEQFTGSTLPDRLGGSGLNFDTVRAALFGKYTTEVNLLAVNKSIQEELKMDEKQVKKAVEVQADLAKRFPPRFSGGVGSEGYEKAMAERSKAVEEALGTVLNEDQAKRFRQLMLQSRERDPNVPPGAISTAIRSAVAYPGVAEAVKFDDEQRKKLIGGTAPDEVLTAAQKSAIKEMLGEPFKGDILPRPLGLPQTTAIVRLLATANKSAEEALKLTDDQAKALTTARAAYQKAIADARPLGPAGATPGDSAAARRAAIEAFDKAVTDLLNADQKQRLAQIVIQLDAAQDLVATLTAPEMAKKLELTADQTTKLTTLGQEATQLQNLRTTHLRLDRDAKLGLQMRDAADDRVVALLSDAQKKKWKELTGEPLSGLTKTVPGRFGPFGPGGPGGFGGPGGGFIPPGGIEP